MLGSGRVATQVLHDYLFTSVEKKLGDKILGITEDSISGVNPGSLFRISGKGELDDIERMLHIMKNQNDTYAHLLALDEASEIQERVWDLEDRLEDEARNSRGNSQAPSGKKKRRVPAQQQSETQKQLDELAPDKIAAAVLRKRRTGISPLISEAFSRLYGRFYNDIFEVKIITGFDDDTVFRGIVNKQHLRDAPRMIYAKYGTRPSVDWTMVGQVTTILEPKFLDDDESHDEESDSEDERNLRDSFEALFNTISNLEEHLVRSSFRTTYIATPLAIFHEIT